MDGGLVREGKGVGKEAWLGVGNEWRVGEGLWLVWGMDGGYMASTLSIVLNYSQV